MGGRGKPQEAEEKEKLSDHWKWLQEVETSRLKKYIGRSNHLGSDSDPQGRSIHDVAYHAKNELRRRNE